MSGQILLKWQTIVIYIVYSVTVGPMSEDEIKAYQEVKLNTNIGDFSAQTGYRFSLVAWTHTLASHIHCK